MNIVIIFLLCGLLIGCAPHLTIQELPGNRYWINSEVYYAYWLIPYGNLDESLRNASQMTCPGYQILGEKTGWGINSTKIKAWTIQCPEGFKMSR